MILNPLPVYSQVDSTLFVAEILKDQFVHLKLNAGQQFDTISIYAMASGRNREPKIQEGDYATPRGLYHIYEILAGERLNPLYGPLILKLDFPTQQDRTKGIGGSNIWLHGTERGIPLTYTRGCLSIKNSVLVPLAKELQFGIPILITDSITTLPTLNTLRASKENFQANYLNKKQPEHVVLREIEMAELYLAREADFLKQNNQYESTEKIEYWMNQKLQSFYLDWLSGNKYLLESWYTPSFLAHSPRKRVHFFEEQQEYSLRRTMNPFTLDKVEWTMESKTKIQAHFPYYYQGLIEGENVQKSGYRKIIWELVEKKWTIIDDSGF